MWLKYQLCIQLAIAKLGEASSKPWTLVKLKLRQTMATVLAESEEGGGGQKSTLGQAKTC